MWLTVNYVVVEPNDIGGETEDTIKTLENVNPGKIIIPRTDEFVSIVGLVTREFKVKRVKHLTNELDGNTNSVINLFLEKL